MTAPPLTQLKAELDSLRFGCRASNRIKSFHYGLLHDSIMFTQVLSEHQVSVIRGLAAKVDDQSSDKTFAEMKYILSSAGLSITPRID